jgi:NAD(P)-dependent dehydrogenase (short-subunit alcohol dehydrogenase family)
VTGGNSGIGLHTARGLARAGARVVLACRDLDRARTAAATVPGADVAQLDLSDLESVAAYAVPDRLDALVCNAGVMGGVYLPSAQGHERQMATNHLGHAALIARLWPALEAAAGRVVLVASIAARGGQLTPTTTVADLVFPQPYVAQVVYSSTKQANLVHAQELHRRTVASRSAVTVTAAHPGVSNTELFARQQVDSGHPRLAPVAKALGAVLFQSAHAGAQATLRALVASPGSFVGPRLLNQVRGRPQLLDVYAGAADPATAARLWELTEQVLGHALPPG